MFHGLISIFFTILRNERGNKALLENNIPWSFVFFLQWRQFMEHICQQGMHLVSRVHAKLKCVSGGYRPAATTQHPPPTHHHHHQSPPPTAASTSTTHHPSFLFFLAPFYLRVPLLASKQVLCWGTADCFYAGQFPDAHECQVQGLGGEPGGPINHRPQSTVFDATVPITTLLAPLTPPGGKKCNIITFLHLP